MSTSILSCPARLRARRFPDHTVLALVVAAFFVAVITVPAAAEVLVVYADGSGDYPTISDALGVAEDGDIIELGDGVFSGPGNSTVWGSGDNVIRSASGNPSSCVIDLGDGGAWGWHGGSAHNHDVLGHEGITFRNGYIELGGLGPSPNSSIDYTAVNCVFDRCPPVLLWYIWGTFVNCRFERTGAVSLRDVSFASCTFLGPAEGGMYPYVRRGIYSLNRLVVEDCYFRGYEVQTQGGAIEAQADGELEEIRISGCTFVENAAQEAGGAIAHLGNDDLVQDLLIENCTFHGNRARAG